MKLIQLEGWGEHSVTEPSSGVRQWLLESSQEEQDSHCWPQVSSQGACKKMKQLELSFSRILDLETEPESEDEHARRMDENPTKLHVETDTISTGRMTKKETREQAGKNKSI